MKPDPGKNILNQNPSCRKSVCLITLFYVQLLQVNVIMLEAASRWIHTTSDHDIDTVMCNAGSKCSALMGVT